MKMFIVVLSVEQSYIVEMARACLHVTKLIVLCSDIFFSTISYPRQSIE